MKTSCLKILMSMMILVSVGYAQAATTENLHANSFIDTSNYRGPGFHAGLSPSLILGGMSLSECEDDEGDCVFPAVLPGKLDITLGYQFNPYIALDVKLWTFWFIAYGLEIAPKINFTKTRVSPFISGSAGAGVIAIFHGYPIHYLSSGLGVDFGLSKNSQLSLRADVYFLGSTVEESDSNIFSILAPQIAYQFTF